MNSKINLAKYSAVKSAPPTAVPSDVMTATIDLSKDGTTIRSSHRKEKGFSGSIAAIIPATHNPRQSRKIVEIRFYSTASTCYACLWANGDSVSFSGSGKAGGYGYHKASAAASEAVFEAGITLSQRIDGVGNTAIETAVMAIATALGYPEALLVVTHP